MPYKTKNRIKVFTQNATVNDTDFSGWMAVNTGTADVQVNKITLEPQQGLDFMQAVPADSTWDSPIQIVILAAGGEVTLTQLIHKEQKDDSVISLLRQILRKIK